MSLPLAMAKSTDAESEPVPLHEAYRACEEIVRAHYENFPVASRFLPADRRIALAAIYAFARRADDIADAEAPSGERLRALDTVEEAFHRALDGEPRGAIFTALADAIERNRLPAEPFLDLLEAFRMDARDAIFATWDELLAYCRGSANTVGRLVLALHEIDDPEALRASDDVCTALQLTNFWQDLGPDLARGRLFVPLEDLDRFDLGRDTLTHASSRPGLARLLTHECRATRELFRRGAGVARHAPFLLSLHLRASIAGGLAILNAVDRLGWRVLEHRPTLSPPARFAALLRSALGFDA